jgi:LysM repeat protein
MKPYRLLMYFIIITLVVSAVACTRSIPSKSQPTKAATAQSVATAATEAIDIINMFATQTAMATQGQASVPIVQPTQQIPVATAPAPLATPTVLVAIVVPTATPGLPTTYTIQKGEFPFCIARRYNVNPSELLGINGLSTYTVVSTGTVLRIPQTGHPFPGNRALRPHPTQYTVASSQDTIYSVACLFGDVDPGAIAFANGLQPPYKLMAGQVLQIP